MKKLTDEQKSRIRDVINKFDHNNPMIVSQEKWELLKENNLLDDRILVKNDKGLIIKIPWRNGVKVL